MINTEANSYNYVSFMSQSNGSFTDSINKLFNISGELTTQQSVILLDNIINNNNNNNNDDQSVEGLDNRTQLVLSFENTIKQQLISEDEVNTITIVTS